jgi:hypothetical protein
MIITLTTILSYNSVSGYIIILISIKRDLTCPQLPTSSAGDECLRLTRPATDCGQLGHRALTKAAAQGGHICWVSWPEMKESSQKNKVCSTVANLENKYE